MPKIERIPGSGGGIVPITQDQREEKVKISSNGKSIVTFALKTLVYIPVRLMAFLGVGFGDDVTIETTEDDLTK